MSRYIWISLLMMAVNPAVGVEPSAVDLPPGVKAVWDLGKAYHETTPTRERICINGLWRWQPAEVQAGQAPTENWGYFKVPGCWPGIGDYMQKDSQTVYSHPSWKDRKLGGITAAWYERQIAIPGDWAGRHIAVSIEYLNSYATLYVDGAKAGEVRFPGGEVDLTSVCKPGGTYRLSLLVVALPLKGVMLSYTDSASAREVKGSVNRRGLCGDVYLVSTPAGAHIADMRVDTSVRKQELTLDVAIEGLSADADSWRGRPALGKQGQDGLATQGLEALATTRYMLRTRVMKDGRTVKEFTSRAFQASDRSMGVPPMSSTAVPAVTAAGVSPVAASEVHGRDARATEHITVTEKWMPDKLWDIHTPGNQYDLEVSLVDAGGKVLDTGWTMRFGFRELWIDGRDFYLNGTRIFLSALPIDNAAVGAALSTYEAARESLIRLQGFGINFVYTHNYGCEPGSHLGFAEILRAADDVGMLVSFSQPHFSHYEWQAPDADRSNGYARHAEFYVRTAQNHPAVVMYSMSHNGTGYSEDMNPDMIDGIHDDRDQWAMKNVKLALRAEEIVKHLDPSRIVYHHA